MSHYYDDLPYDDTQEKLDKRRGKAMDKLLPTNLSKLTVADLVQLLNVLRPSYKMHRFDDRDATSLEDIAKKV